LATQFIWTSYLLETIVPSVVLGRIFPFFVVNLTCFVNFYVSPERICGNVWVQTLDLIIFIFSTSSFSKSIILNFNIWTSVQVISYMLLLPLELSIQKLKVASSPWVYYGLKKYISMLVVPREKQANFFIEIYWFISSFLWFFYWISICCRTVTCFYPLISQWMFIQYLIEAERTFP
jgi:hypothetical protein